MSQRRQNLRNRLTDDASTHGKPVPVRALMPAAATRPIPAEKPALGENAPSGGDHVSCINFTLSDGATTMDVDASSTCHEACHDRRDHLLRSNETTTDRHEPHMYDHDKRMGYYDYYYYHRDDPRSDDGSYEAKRKIGLFVECYCQSGGSWTYEDDESDYLCGPTRIGQPLPAPEDPLPRCFADMDIVSIGDCQKKCDAMYSLHYWDVTWVPFRSHLQQSNGCTCELAGGLEVQICGEPARFGTGGGDGTPSFFNDNEEGGSGGLGGSLPQSGAIAAVVIAVVMIIVGGKISAKERAERRTRNGRASPSPELNDFRQRRRQQQQETGAESAAAPSSEEQERLRRDVIKSCIFTHTLAEDADGTNLASIIAGAGGNGDDNSVNEEAADSTETVPAAGTAGGIFGTIRSAISNTVRSPGKPECSICLTEYQSGDTISWAREDSCDHIYHEQCIAEWLSTAKRDGSLNDSCPLCRTKLIILDGDEE